VPSYPYPEGPMVPMAEAIKKRLKVPVIVAGKLNAEAADRVIAGGQADFVAMGGRSWPIPSCRTRSARAAWTTCGAASTATTA